MNREALRDLQLKVCKGCMYADKRRVGSGYPCCTHPRGADLSDGRCGHRKEVSQ